MNKVYVRSFEQVMILPIRVLCFLRIEKQGKKIFTLKIYVYNFTHKNDDVDKVFSCLDFSQNAFAEIHANNRNILQSNLNNGE